MRKNTRVRQNEERRARAMAAAEVCIQHLKERFHVKEVYLCGSLAGESPWHSRSDIDLVVEGLEPGQYIEALTELWELLPPDLELDLIRFEEASPGLLRRIHERRLEEAPMPEGPKEDPLRALRIEVQEDLQNLERVAGEMAQLLARMPKEPTFVEIRAAASMVHDFYTGIERIFERIAIRIDGDIPPGPSWHTDLLRRMEKPFGQVRPAIINHRLALTLLEYLRFRHMFRHTYGYEIMWEKVRPLAEGLSGVLGELHRQLQEFLSPSP